MSRDLINPALRLRAAVKALGMPGMLRWDATSRALLVSDAPRREAAGGWMDTLRKDGLRVTVQDGLLWIDLPTSAYGAMLRLDFAQGGPWREAWFAEQALLGSILIRPQKHVRSCAADESLLRMAMLACARGEHPVRLFLHRLRSADAAALRVDDVASSRAAAVLCAGWLWSAQGVGLPPLVRVSDGPFC